MNSTKALHVSQNVEIPFDDSSHRSGSSFSLDALSKVCEPFPNNLSFGLWPCEQQTILEDRVTDLKDLIQGEDGQAVSQDLQNLVVRVLSEIEIWLNRGGAMTFEAQITLSNMAYKALTKDSIRNQLSCKVLQIHPIYSSYSTYNLN